jgi:hypothetical protein
LADPLIIIGVSPKWIHQDYFIMQVGPTPDLMILPAWSRYPLVNLAFDIRPSRNLDIFIICMEGIITFMLI